MMGILFLSIDAILSSHVLVGAALFAVVMNMKHIFVYMAPVFFAYILKNYCFCSPLPTGPTSQPAQKEKRQGEEDSEDKMREEEEDRDRPRFSLFRFVQVALVVIAVGGLSVGPFVILGQVGQVLSRLFPFGRGLCNAYWAPNFWAIYNVLDKVLARVLGINGTGKGMMTGGIVGEFEHVVLPVIKPLYTFILTLAATTPLLWKLLDGTRKGHVFIAALVQCSLCFFMFSWHVHEKAVLMPILLLTLLAGSSMEYAGIFFFGSTVAHYSLFPLLFTPREYPTKLLLVATYTLAAWVLLPQMHTPTSRRRGGLAAEQNWVRQWEGVYLVGLAVLEFYGSWAHERMWGVDRLPFLPLLLTSLYCAIGLLYFFARLYLMFLATLTPWSSRVSACPPCQALFRQAE